MTTTNQKNETQFLRYKESIITQLDDMIELLKNEHGFEDDIHLDEPNLDNFKAYIQNYLWEYEDYIFDIAEESINT